MYFVVEDRAINELKLKGAELLVYSLIATCSQKGDGCWHGGYEALAKRTGYTKANTIKAVDHLITKGLISKKAGEIGGRMANILEIVGYCNDTDRGIVMELQGYRSDTDRGIETIPNNKIDNKDDKREIYERKFRKPTLQELSDYITSHSYVVDAHGFMDYYDSTGWTVGKKPMKDWQAAVRNWHRRHEEERKSSPERKNNTPADIIRMMTER